MENGVVTVLYFFAERRGRPLKSFHDFWDTLVYSIFIFYRNPTIVVFLFYNFIFPNRPSKKDGFFIFTTLLFFLIFDKHSLELSKTAHCYLKSFLTTQNHWDVA